MLTVTSFELDGSTSTKQSIPCTAGADVDICLVEVRFLWPVFRECGMTQFGNAISRSTGIVLHKSVPLLARCVNHIFLSDAAFHASVEKPHYPEGPKTVFHS